MIGNKILVGGGVQIVAGEIGGEMFAIVESSRKSGGGGRNGCPCKGKIYVFVGDKSRNGKIIGSFCRTFKFIGKPAGACFINIVVIGFIHVTIIIGADFVRRGAVGGRQGMDTFFFSYAVVNGDKIIGMQGVGIQTMRKLA